MPVFVDDAAICYRGKARYHLAADSVEELHGFALQIGIRRCWFHRGRFLHYDVTGEQRDRAIAAGARAVTSRELVRHMRTVALAVDVAEPTAGDFWPSNGK
jgi:hypothetical protein